MSDRLNRLINTFFACVDIDKFYLQNQEEKLADWLRENGVIVPPCKVGDTVYLISELSPKNIVDFTVKALHITSGKNSFGHKAPSYALLSNNVLKRLSTRANFEDFGKTVFLTKEKAEESIKSLEVTQ